MGKGYKIFKENICYYNILNFIGVLVGNNFYLVVYMGSCIYCIIENCG